MPAGKLIQGFHQGMEEKTRKDWPEELSPTGEHQILRGLLSVKSAPTIVAHRQGRQLSIF